MRSVDITHDPIATEIDRDTILQVKARFLKLNQQRYDQSKWHLSARQQQYIDLLPLLFHYNHPRLPGYQSKTTVAGFANYTPTSQQVQLAKKLVKGFTAPSSHGRKQPLLALYVMGSTGTVAQSNNSDMDFWLCHSADIQDDALLELEKKCNALSLWAKSIDLEWHFFLMQPEAFSRGEHGKLSKEGSGSFQHFLLLDEFYRSAILLAGQIPLWWFITATEKGNYTNTKEIITTKGFLRPQEWLDFGPVGDVPPSEFVSAAVWQLYKSITSPFKSLLKLLVLEVYLSKYPHVFTLSDQMKMFIYAGQFNTATLDPYLMLLNELTSYFENNREFDRLELMRQCFYFKLQKSYQSIQKDVNAKDLLTAIEKWQWQPLSFSHLDSSASWNAQQVMNERRNTIRELTASYKALLEKARRAQPSINVNSQEITVLGRKLHAAFGRSTGKIELINPTISNDVTAKYLIFLWDKSAGTWQMYLTNGRWEKSRTAISSSRSIAELFCWAIINKILSSSTRIKVQGHDLIAGPETSYLLKIFDDLELDAYLNPTHAAFTRPAQLLFITVLVNDPTCIAPDTTTNERPFESDPLNTSQGSLIKNYSALSINSWGEVRVQQLGENLSDLLHWLLGHPSANAKIQVRSLRQNSAALIEQRLLQLCTDTLRYGLPSEAKQGANNLFLMVADNKYLLAHFHQGWQVQDIERESTLWDQLAQATDTYRALIVDTACSNHKLIKATGLMQLADLPSGSIHVIFRVKGKKAKLFLKDERGTLVRFDQDFHDQNALLKPIHHFLRAILNRNPIDGAHSMFGIFPIEFHELVERDGVSMLERRHATSAISNLRLFELQFCIESLDLSQPPNKWQLSAWLNGESVEAEGGKDLFETVAQAILCHRQSGQRYPCYITDLDLSMCEHQIPHVSRLQTSHFLKLKVRLEQALNHALQNM